MKIRFDPDRAGVLFDYPCPECGHEGPHTLIAVEQECDHACPKCNRCMCVCGERATVTVECGDSECAAEFDVEVEFSE